jgi:hypothetical protein
MGIEHEEERGEVRRGKIIQIFCFFFSFCLSDAFCFSLEKDEFASRNFTDLHLI